MEYTYYGRIEDLTINEAQGLHLHMIDEYIDKIIKKHTKKFVEQVETVIKDFKELAFTDMKDVKNKVDKCHKAILLLASNMPEIETKVKSTFFPPSKQYKKPKADKDIENDSVL